MESMETKLYPNNVILRKEYDLDPPNPREWDNLGNFIHWHRSDHVGDKSGMEAGFESPNDFLEFIKRDGGVYHNVYLYDHSVQTVSIHSFVGRAQHADWDSGQVGFIYATRESILKKYSVKRITKGIREKALKVLECEVEAYDDFITGQCFGYKVELLDAEEVKACDGDEDAIKELEGEHLDSCWGFYGKEYFDTESESQALYWSETGIPKRILENATAGAGI